MLLRSRPLQVAAATAFLTAGVFAGTANAQTVPDQEPVAIAATPTPEDTQAEAVTATASDSLAYAAFPVALLAVAAGTVVAAQGRRDASPLT